MSQSPDNSTGVPLVPEAADESAAGALLRGATDDLRPKMPEPPPVTLISVGDVSLLTVAGRESLLDAFYVDLLRFRRGEDSAEACEVVYSAENHDLRFHVVETPPERDSCRAIGVVTPHFTEIIEILSARKYEFEYVRGLHAGMDGILLQDPVGNWLAITPRREMR